MNKKKAVIGILTPVFLVLLVIVSVRISIYLKGISLQQAKAAMESMGSMASAVFIMLCVLRGLVFVPCGLMSALGGMLFGRLIGTVYTLFGLTAGSVITFYLARGFGRGWVRRVLGKKYQEYESYISNDSFNSIFLMRVLPILPFDAVSCISGVSGAKVGWYIMATLAGSLPGVFIYVSFGDSIRSLSIKRMILSVALIAAFVFLHFSFKYALKVLKKTA